jgi:hypothetical protein
MVKKVTMPVTPDGNDPADYDESTLEALNRQVDKANANISPREAREYIDLYEQLKAKCAVRGQDVIKCPATNAKYHACLAVLGES